MVPLAAESAGIRHFDRKSLRLALAEIAQCSYGNGTAVNQDLEESWK